MKILITGAAGQLGFRTAVRLAGDHDIVAYDAADRPDDFPGGTRYIQADLRDADQVRRAAEGCEAVIHLGAIPGPIQYLPKADIFAVNTQGTYHVLEAAARAGTRIAVVASSLCAIGFPTALDAHSLAYLPIDEQHPCRPRHAYDLTKLVNERTAEMFTRMAGLTTICLRFPALVDVRTSPWWPLQVYKDPPRLVLADYLDFADAVTVIELALGRTDLEHEILFVNAETSGTHIPTPEYIRRFSPAVEWRGDPPTATTPLVNTARARRVLNFAPTVTWQQGMAELPKPPSEM